MFQVIENPENNTIIEATQDFNMESLGSSQDSEIQRLDQSDYNELEFYRDHQMALLSNVNRSQILETLPTIHQIEESLIQNFRYWQPSRSEEDALSSISQKGANFREYLDLLKQPEKWHIKSSNRFVKEYKDNFPIAMSEKNQKYWKRLLKSLPVNSALISDPNLEYFGVSIPLDNEVPDHIGAPNNILLQFSGKSFLPSDNGIRVFGMMLTNKDGSQFINLRDLLPEESRIFCYGESPFNKHIAGHIMRRDSYHYKPGFDIALLAKPEAAPEILIHEGEHIKFFNEKGLKISDWGGLFLTRLFTDKSIIGASALSLIAGNPMFAIGGVLANLGLYAVSKYKNNFIGKGYYTHMETEARSYLTGKVFNKLLEKNGFEFYKKGFNTDEKVSTSNGRQKSENLSQWQFDYAYEPFFFFLVDRLVNSVKSKKNFAAASGVPQTAYSIPSLIGTNINP